MASPERALRTLVVVPIPAQKYGCQHCKRSAAVEVNGSLIVKNSHGGDIHENIFPLADVIESGVSRMNAQQAKEVLRQAAKRLSDLGVPLGAV